MQEQSLIPQPRGIVSDSVGEHRDQVLALQLIYAHHQVREIGRQLAGLEGGGKQGERLIDARLGSVARAGSVHLTLIRQGRNVSSWPEWIVQSKVGSGSTSSV